MKIGIDIDGTITNNFSLIKKLACNYFAKNENEIQNWDWDFGKVFDVPLNEVQNFWLEHEEIIYNVPGPHPFAVDTINLLAKKHEIIYITARTDTFYNETISWLRKHNFHFNRIFMTKEKEKICLKENISVLVDDAPEYVSIAEHIPLIMFDYPYNENISHPQVTKVKTWQDVYKTITSVEKGLFRKAFF